MSLFKAHYNLEKHSVGFVVAIILAASVGGLVEIAPLFTIDETVETLPDMRVYTPLELAGRNIYVREGCYACHSQMVRSLADELDRYGPYSLASESAYDHPMLWGSKRTGPDLARLGGKYSDDWHVAHLIDPRSVVPASIMPSYPWLATNRLEVADLGTHLAALRRLGVPYTDEMITNAAHDALAQTRPEDEDAAGLVTRYGAATSLRPFSGADRLTEMDALVAYLQVLGQLSQVPYALSTPAGAAP
ncbi:cytochrome-c oxidase, cbb3-type subunit II [Paracoccaceae bacterium]